MISPLPHAHLSEAVALLERACAFDRASVVAEEKLFADAPVIPRIALGETSRPPGHIGVSAFGAYADDTLVGVAAVSGRYLRVLAVDPAARGRGIGSTLLATCEAHAKAAGEPRLRALDQPGNYLAPGIDERNVDTIGWLERRGWKRGSETRENVLLDVRGNPRVTPERLAELIAKAKLAGYTIRRARPDESALLAAVQVEFGGAWPFEVERALTTRPVGVYVAVQGSTYCGFAAHDGNNRGLGWFGPTGTWPAHRGKCLGEVLLLACLVDVAAHHARCEVAWIGPRPFYDKVAGVVADRRFVVMTRDFE